MTPNEECIVDALKQIVKLLEELRSLMNLSIALTVDPDRLAGMFKDDCSKWTKAAEEADGIGTTKQEETK